MCDKVKQAILLIYQVSAGFGKRIWISSYMCMHEGIEKLNNFVHTSGIFAGHSAKRPLQRLTMCQKCALEAAFANCSYLNKFTLMKVLQETGLTKPKVIMWFKDQRKQIRSGKIQGPISLSKHILYMYNTHAYSVYTHAQTKTNME